MARWILVVAIVACSCNQLLDLKDVVQTMESFSCEDAGQTFGVICELNSAL